MPLYEFDCLNCGQSFEKFVRSVQAIKEVVCPACTQAHVQKKFSVFATNIKGGSSRSASEVPGFSAACTPGGT